MMGGRIRDAEAELNLPAGFRFHPTDEELIVHYLCRRASHQHIPVPIIAELDLYKYNPWDLPDKALFGTREWYFFTPRDRKYPNGSRPNRAAGRGYWKATGADKPVAPAGSFRPIGIKKALVFYDGKPPKGAKTDWIMHEYRLADANRSARRNGSLRLDDWVLCRLYNKNKGWVKTLKQETDLTEEGFRTPESDIELPDFDDFRHVGEDMNRSLCVAQIPAAAAAIKEEYDWYNKKEGWEKELKQETDLTEEGFRTPESDIELPDFDDFRHVGEDMNQRLCVEQIPAVAPAIKEEYDWYFDLNLEDLQNSFGPFRSTPAFDVSTQECYVSSLISPKSTANLALF